MPRFAYRARDLNDRILSGTVECSVVDEALEQLSTKNLIPLSVEELNFDGSRKNQSFTEKINEALLRMQNKVPYKAVVFFTRQLATMLSGGVPLARSL